MGREFCFSSAPAPMPIKAQSGADGGGGGGVGFSFPDPLLLYNAKVSSSNQRIGYGAPCLQQQSMLHMQVESHDLINFANQEGKIYASEAPMDMESCVNTEMGEKSKVAQTHHFPQHETDHSCEIPNDDIHLHQFSEGDQINVFPRTSIGNPLDDGYNWRKYGQKQVKGNKYPRSYYKCTHPLCQARRKVEHELKGHITKINYMGNHNHKKPLSSKRPALVSSYKLKDKTSDSVVDHREDLKPYFQDMGSSASGVTKSSQIPAKFSTFLEGVSRLSTRSSKNDEVVATERTIYFGNVDDSDSKTRMKDGSLEKVQGSDHLCQPKVVVQTVSEVDVLDDGYRWRKYGQKVVKGNPNARSYYKCNTPGCPVRKHIERAADDVRSVITSYEGNHNHEVPGAKNSNNICSGGNTHFSELNSQTPYTPCGPTWSKPELRGLIPGLCNDFGSRRKYSKAFSCGSGTEKEILDFLCQKALQPSPPMPRDAFGMGNRIRREVPRVFPMQNFAQEFPNSYSMESDHSEYASASCDLSRSGGIVSEFRTSNSYVPKRYTMKASMNPEMEVFDHPSAVSISHHGPLSPLETVSDGQLSNSEKITERVLK